METLCGIHLLFPFARGILLSSQSTTVVSVYNLHSGRLKTMPLTYDLVGILKFVREEIKSSLWVKATVIVKF